MPTKKHGLIIETPIEARQAEPGPSILFILAISTVLAVSGWPSSDLTDWRGNRHDSRLTGN